MAADLIRRRVTVIVASGLSPALAAKSASATVPIVFRTGNDPIQYGLVASLNWPGGNVTGVNDIGADLGPKRLGLLHELLPGASRFAALVNPTNPATESTIAEVTAGALAIGRSMDIVPASTDRESLVGRQVARAALGDRARAQAGGNHVQSRHVPRIDLYALT